MDNYNFKHGELLSYLQTTDRMTDTTPYRVIVNMRVKYSEQFLARS